MGVFLCFIILIVSACSTQLITIDRHGLRMCIFVKPRSNTTRADKQYRLIIVTKDYFLLNFAPRIQKPYSNQDISDI